MRVADALRGLVSTVLACLCCAELACCGHDPMNGADLGQAVSCDISEANCHDVFIGELPDECRLNGNCHPIGCECHATTDLDCLSSQVCAKWGQCGVYHNRCEAVSRMGCKGVECTEQGQCVAVGDLCQATDGTCAASSNCAMVGACHSFVLGTSSANAPVTACQPISQDDCESSSNCKQQGICHFFEKPLGIGYGNICGIKITQP